jgi:hypothetical protein
MQISKEDKKKRIENLIDSYKKLESSFEDIFKIFGSGVIESELWESVYKSFDMYSNLVSEITGDKDEWITWYIYDNSCGEKGYTAGYHSNVKPIKNIDDLVDLIEAALEFDPNDIKTNI